MKLRTRINLISLSVICLVVIFNTLFIVAFISNDMKKNAEATALSMAKQQMLTVDNVFDTIVTMTQKPMINNEVLSVLQKDYSKLSRIEANAYKDKADIIFNDFFYTDMFYKNEYVYAVTVFSLNDNQSIYYKQRSGHSIKKIKYASLDWYKKIVNSKGKGEIIFPKMKEDLYQDDTSIIALGRLLIDPQTNKPMGIIRIDIDVDTFKTIWGENNVAYGKNDVLLVDQNNETLFSTIKQKNIRKSFVKNQKNNINIQTNSDRYNLKLYTLVLKSQVYKEVYVAIIIIVIIGIICLSLAYFLTRLTTKEIMKPIKELNRNMKLVRNGNLDVKMPISHSIGEFEEVCETFNLMVINTKNLVSRVKEEEEEKKRLEYSALQAQISPHFISNTISTIRWMAYIQGNKSIEEALDSFYHILSFAAREHDEKIPIRTELEQMNYYVDIISLRYYNKFHINFNVDEEVKNYYTIKYLLQTLVENSIFHGLEGTESEGEIDVCIYLKEQNIIYEVRDNGIGIDSERIKEILSGNYQKKRENGIGIYNIMRRIQLEFGYDYGVSIESQVDKYTLVRVSMPAERVK